MPRKVTVSTVNSWGIVYTYALEDKKFQGTNSHIGFHNHHWTTRTNVKKLFAKLDKIESKFGRDNDKLEFLSLSCGYGEIKPGPSGYNWDVLFNDEGGVSIGCMVFDKATTAKIKRWATATVAKTATKTKTATSRKVTKKAA